MPKVKQGKTKDGKVLHYSVGALIKKDGKYLLIDRTKRPFGYACIAGHMDEGETPQDALIREVKEEAGLDITSQKLVFDEVMGLGTCRHGVVYHQFYVFDCSYQGELNLDLNEAKSAGWFTPDEIKKLLLTKGWKYRLKKIGVI